jgi:hypothetical protein
MWPKVRNAKRFRSGATLVLVTVMLLVIALMTAITVDFAFIQLTRTEMRAATDAAAKAGAEALARTEDVSAARAAARHYASLNTVAGTSMKIRDSDIEIGRLDEVAGEAKLQFFLNASPPNAVRVSASTGGSSLHPAVPLFFSGVHGKATFAPSFQATAGQQEVEVCLVLDRSGSMLFDMSGTEFVYPSNNPLLMPTAQWDAIKKNFSSSQWTMWRNHLSAPHPSASRWAVLQGAIDLFLTEAGQYEPQPRTSLVTWASNYTMPVNPLTVFVAAKLDVPLPGVDGFSWVSNKAGVLSAVQALGSKPMMGATNLSSGVDLAVATLTGANSKGFTNKVAILFTDGQWNDGRHPIEAAQDARRAGVIVHCVTLLTADQADVRQVAEITGGRYYRTSNEAELRDAFRELARSLPVVLTD